jgi:hypothetical protein
MYEILPLTLPLFLKEPFSQPTLKAFSSGMVSSEASESPKISSGVASAFVRSNDNTHASVPLPHAFLYRFSSTYGDWGGSRGDTTLPFVPSSLASFIATMNHNAAMEAASRKDSVIATVDAFTSSIFPPLPIVTIGAITDNGGNNFDPTQDDIMSPPCLYRYSSLEVFQSPKNLSPMCSFMSGVFEKSTDEDTPYDHVEFPPLPFLSDQLKDTDASSSPIFLQPKWSRGTSSVSKKAFHMMPEAPHCDNWDSSDASPKGVMNDRMGDDDSMYSYHQHYFAIEEAENSETAPYAFLFK